MNGRNNVVYKKPFLGSSFVPPSSTTISIVFWVVILPVLKEVVISFEGSSKYLISEAILEH